MECAVTTRLALRWRRDRSLDQHHGVRPVLERDTDNLLGIRALFDTLRGGITDIRRQTGIVSVTAVLVAIATGLVLANPLVAQLDAVVETGVLRRSAVVVQVVPPIDDNSLAVEGVEDVSVSSGHDLTKVGVDGDVNDYRTLELDGSVLAEVVIDRVESIAGVGDAYVRRGIRVSPTLDRAIELLPVATPAAIGVWSLALLAILFSLLRRAGRLTLASRWARWSIVVLIPTVATVFLVAFVASVVWPPIARPMISSLAVADISGSEVLDWGVRWGLRALAFAWVALTVMAIASTLTRRGRHG